MATRIGQESFSPSVDSQAFSVEMKLVRHGQLRNLFLLHVLQCCWVVGNLAAILIGEDDLAAIMSG